MKLEGKTEYWHSFNILFIAVEVLPSINKFFSNSSLERVELNFPPLEYELDLLLLMRLKYGKWKLVTLKWWKPTTRTKQLRLIITSNKSDWYHVSSDMTQWTGHFILVGFVSQIHNFSLIKRRNQTNPGWEELHNILLVFFEV